MIPPSFLEVTTEKLLYVFISFSGYSCLDLDDYSEYHKNLIQLLSTSQPSRQHYKLIFGTGR